MLYQLSYFGIFSFCECKGTAFFERAKFFPAFFAAPCIFKDKAAGAGRLPGGTGETEDAAVYGLKPGAWSVRKKAVGANAPTFLQPTIQAFSGAFFISPHKL